jgi:hypothetical protein
VVNRPVFNLCQVQFKISRLGWVVMRYLMKENLESGSVGLGW